MRPVPFGVWLFGLATLMQGAAALYALFTEGDRRGVVMGVSATFFLIVTVVMYVRRPVVESADDR